MVDVMTDKEFIDLVVQDINARDDNKAVSLRNPENLAKWSTVLNAKMVEVNELISSLNVELRSTTDEQVKAGLKLNQLKAQSFRARVRARIFETNRLMGLPRKSERMMDEKDRLIRSLEEKNKHLTNSNDQLRLANSQNKQISHNHSLKVSRERDGFRRCLLEIRSLIKEGVTDKKTLLDKIEEAVFYKELEPSGVILNDGFNETTGSL
jgi:tRNA splicing endonuclease